MENELESNSDELKELLKASSTETRMVRLLDRSMGSQLVQL